MGYYRGFWGPSYSRPMGPLARKIWTVVLSIMLIGSGAYCLYMSKANPNPTIHKLGLGLLLAGCLIFVMFVAFAVLKRRGKVVISNATVPPEQPETPKQ